MMILRIQYRTIIHSTTKRTVRRPLGVSNLMPETKGQEGGNYYDADLSQ